MEKKLEFPLLSFAFLLLFLLHTQIAQGQNRTIPVNVGVVLDMDTREGQMGLSCISMALSDFYASHGFYKTRIVLNNRDSNGDAVGAAAAALNLLKNVEVQAIISHVSSMQADFTIDLGEKARVPIISFSATTPSPSLTRRPYFIRASQDDSSQVKALSSIVKAFGWREVVPIYIGNEFGEGIIPSLVDALAEVNAHIPYRSVIPPSATDDRLVAELYKLMTMQTRVFVVHIPPSLGTRLFTKAKELGMLNEEFAWIITDSLTNWLNSFDPSVIDSMQGVIGVRPYFPKTKDLESFNERWRLKFQQNNPTLLNPELNVFGLWAYDSAIALAMAVENAGVVNLTFQKPNMSKDSSELVTGVSINGPMLLQEILKVKFRGFSGEFQLVDGQLQSPAYQIVNVIGTEAKEIGFWSSVENGIVRQLNVKQKNKYSTAKTNFGAITWPGDTTIPPKGWVTPTNGKKLRVLVPMKNGFTEFVRVKTDPSTYRTTVDGYCIDVFDAIMASLPYAVPYEYFVFSKSDGEIAGTYNDLIDQVYLGNYDIAIGDITITANRSQYVDFTLPFTESGLSMVVRVKDENSDPWVFFKPLSLNLWLASFVFFVLMGILVWTFEHRTNEEFRGPVSQQIATIFWFAFSTMVFAHKEKIINYYSKFILTFWFLVVLILTQVYTASLTSMLTVKKLQPETTNINELIRTYEYVGYQKGSFVLGFLIQRGFEESRLVEYTSPDELDQLFNKGSKNGGIVAAFDEIPYTRVFLSTFPSKYTVIQPTYKVEGFGFVFPIGSSLITDISRAILNVTEGDKMVKIENAWFPQSSSFLDSSTSLISSNSQSIGLKSFSGLFMIVGVTSGLAFIIYMVFFLFDHWNIITNPQLSIRRKLEELNAKFHGRDPNSHTFRTIEVTVETGRDDKGNIEKMIIASPGLNGALELSSMEEPQGAMRGPYEEQTMTVASQEHWDISSEDEGNMATVESSNPKIKEEPQDALSCFPK